MRSEREVREKINSMMNMLNNVKEDRNEKLTDTIRDQLDMLLWFVGDESGLPPIDEDPMYSCYWR